MSRLLCNMCGESTQVSVTYNEDKKIYYDNSTLINVDTEYYSYHLLDGNSYTFRLCEKCIRNMFFKFKIKPFILELMGDGTHEVSYEEDLKIYNYRLWKDNGGFHNAFLNELCNSMQDCPNKAVYTTIYNDDEQNPSELSSCEEHKDYRRSLNSKLVLFIPHKRRIFLYKK